MEHQDQWKQFWEEKGREAVSNFEYDHGRAPRRQEIEALSNEELLSFIDPQPSEVIFDAGCGTGANIRLLHDCVRQVVAMDYNHAAVERCKERLKESKRDNVQVFQGTVTKIEMPDRSVDKVICMSVFQYLGDDDARKALLEFKRIVGPRGVVVLHVKNLSSIYLSTLWAAKKFKSLFQRDKRLEFFRPFSWYVAELTAIGFEIVEYNSFNFLMIDRMPKSLVSYLQALELRNRNKAIFRSRFVRRHGSDLKIKARVNSVTESQSL
jgi:ubiquinone/menaquinone biosynthesis C-methylase UbiE